MNIKLRNITKKFGDIKALDELSCEISDGEFVSFLGSSGSGKSTLLNIIAGITAPTEGNVYFNDEDVTKLTPKERNVGFVFQNYALYPNMTVQNNIGFPLEAMKIKDKEKKRLILEITEMVKISHLLKKKPHELSGGEQQRVALGRALVKKPQLLLLDEPFSNLDPRLSANLRDEIKKLQMKLRITTIMVTHNQAEAMELSNRIALISSGKLIQFDYTRELYEKPNNYFCAQFIGDIKINSVEGTINRGVFSSVAGNIKFFGGNLRDGAVFLCFRPEAVKITKADLNFNGKVTAIYNRGREYVVDIDLDGVSIKALVPINSNIVPALNENVLFGLNKNELFFYDKITGERRMECYV